MIIRSDEGEQLLMKLIKQNMKLADLVMILKKKF